MEWILIGCALLLLMLGCIAWRQPRAGNRVSYWHQTIPGLDETPDRFYAQVYQTLQEGLQIRQISLTGFGFGPTRLFEGTHIFTERPLYLEARYKHLTFYLYASQTPAGFYLSTWMYSKYVTGDDKPTILPRGYRYFARQSLFQYDATLMFSESVHSIVMTVLDRYIQEQQLTPLTEAQRAPVMHAFYGRSMPPTAAPTIPTTGLPGVSGVSPTTSSANSAPHGVPGSDLGTSDVSTLDGNAPGIVAQSDGSEGRRLPLP